MNLIQCFEQAMHVKLESHYRTGLFDYDEAAHRVLMKDTDGRRSYWWFVSMYHTPIPHDICTISKQN